MFPVTDFLEIGKVGRIVLFFCYTPVGYFCGTKQNKQILNKQLRFLYCAPIRMLKQKKLVVLFIDKKN